MKPNGDYDVLPGELPPPGTGREAQVSSYQRSWQVAPLLEPRPRHLRGSRLISGRGTHGRQLIAVRLSHRCFSLSRSFPL